MNDTIDTMDLMQIAENAKQTANMVKEAAEGDPSLWQRVKAAPGRAWRATKAAPGNVVKSVENMGENMAVNGTFGEMAGTGHFNTTKKRLGYAILKHPREATAGLGVIGAGALGGALYGGKKMYDNYKQAGYYEDGYGYDEGYELALAKQAAEELYAESMDKIAYAQDLYDEADYYEKVAAEGDPSLWQRAKAKGSSAWAATKAAPGKAWRATMSAPKDFVDAVGRYGTNLRNAADTDNVMGRGRFNSTKSRLGGVVSRNRKAVAAGLAMLGAGALGGTAYGGKKGYDYYQEKHASDQMYELALAKQAAEELYVDSMDKIAYAQDLYDEADYYEKVAADNGAGTPVAWTDRYTTPAGAIGAAAGGVTGAGIAYALRNKMNMGRMGTNAAIAAAGVAGAGLIGAGAGALNDFMTANKEQRALAQQQSM